MAGGAFYDAQRKAAEEKGKEEQQKQQQRNAQQHQQSVDAGLNADKTPPEISKGFDSAGNQINSQGKIVRFASQASQEKYFSDRGVANTGQVVDVPTFNKADFSDLPSGSIVSPTSPTPNKFNESENLPQTSHPSNIFSSNQTDTSGNATSFVTSEPKSPPPTGRQINLSLSDNVSISDSVISSFNSKPSKASGFYEQTGGVATAKSAGRSYGSDWTNSKLGGSEFYRGSAQEEKAKQAEVDKASKIYSSTANKDYATGGTKGTEQTVVTLGKANAVFGREKGSTQGFGWKDIGGPQFVRGSPMEDYFKTQESTRGSYAYKSTANKDYSTGGTIDNTSVGVVTAQSRGKSVGWADIAPDQFTRGSAKETQAIKDSQAFTSKPNYGGSSEFQKDFVASKTPAEQATKDLLVSQQTPQNVEGRKSNFPESVKSEKGTNDLNTLLVTGYNNELKISNGAISLANKDAVVSEKSFKDFLAKGESQGGVFTFVTSVPPSRGVGPPDQKVIGQTSGPRSYHDYLQAQKTTGGNVSVLVSYPEKEKALTESVSKNTDFFATLPSNYWTNAANKGFVSSNNVQKINQQLELNYRLQMGKTQGSMADFLARDVGTGETASFLRVPFSNNIDKLAGLKQPGQKSSTSLVPSTSLYDVSLYVPATGRIIEGGVILGLRGALKLGQAVSLKLAENALSKEGSYVIVNGRKVKASSFDQYQSDLSRYGTTNPKTPHGVDVFNRPLAPVKYIPPKGNPMENYLSALTSTRGVRKYPTHAASPRSIGTTVPSDVFSSDTAEHRGIVSTARHSESPTFTPKVKGLEDVRLERQKQQENIQTQFVGTGQNIKPQNKAIQPDYGYVVNKNAIRYLSKSGEKTYLPVEQQFQVQGPKGVSRLSYEQPSYGPFYSYTPEGSTKPDLTYTLTAGIISEATQSKTRILPESGMVKAGGDINEIGFGGRLKETAPRESHEVYDVFGKRSTEKTFGDISPRDIFGYGRSVSRRARPPREERPYSPALKYLEEKDIKRAENLATNPNKKYQFTARERTTEKTPESINIFLEGGLSRLKPKNPKGDYQDYQFRKFMGKVAESPNKIYKIDFSGKVPEKTPESTNIFLEGGLSKFKPKSEKGDYPDYRFRQFMEKVAGYENKQFKVDIGGKVPKEKPEVSPSYLEKNGIGKLQTENYSIWRYRKNNLEEPSIGNIRFQKQLKPNESADILKQESLPAKSTREGFTSIGTPDKSFVSNANIQGKRVKNPELFGIHVDLASPEIQSQFKSVGNFKFTGTGQFYSKGEGGVWGPYTKPSTSGFGGILPTSGKPSSSFEPSTRETKVSGSSLVLETVENPLIGKSGINAGWGNAYEPDFGILGNKDYFPNTKGPSDLLSGSLSGSSKHALTNKLILSYVSSSKSKSKALTSLSSMQILDQYPAIGSKYKSRNALSTISKIKSGQRQGSKTILEYKQSEKQQNDQLPKMFIGYKQSSKQGTKYKQSFSFNNQPNLKPKQSVMPAFKFQPLETPIQTELPKPPKIPKLLQIPGGYKPKKKRYRTKEGPTALVNLGVKNIFASSLDIKPKRRYEF